MLTLTLRLAVALVVVAAGCSGVSQADFDELQANYDAARDQIAAADVERAELLAAETATAAYVAATDPFDLRALENVYTPDLVFFDAARGITFRTRETALADLASGITAFGMEMQIARSITVSAERAVVEWETRGVDDIGSDWSFRGVSVLVFEDGLVSGETLYYDPSDAPWGGG